MRRQKQDFVVDFCWDMLHGKCIIKKTYLMIPELFSRVQGDESYIESKTGLFSWLDTTKMINAIWTLTHFPREVASISRAELCGNNGLKRVIQRLRRRRHMRKNQSSALYSLQCCKLSIDGKGFYLRKAMQHFIETYLLQQKWRWRLNSEFSSFMDDIGHWFGLTWILYTFLLRKYLHYIYFLGVFVRNLLE